MIDTNWICLRSKEAPEHVSAQYEAPAGKLLCTAGLLDSCTSSSLISESDAVLRVIEMCQNERTRDWTGEY